MLNGFDFQQERKRDDTVNKMTMKSTSNITGTP